MFLSNRYLSAGAAMVALIGSAVVAEVSLNSTLRAQETFPDVPADYWATPFIQVLAREGIVSGYPDGTFRPQQPIHRDEFSALVRQAFNEEEIREIPSASVFSDVPEGYWAETPIEEAYEAGFLNAPSENTFEPQEPVSKVSALIALTRGLELVYESPSTTTTQSTYTPVTPARKRQAAKRPLMFPLASTALMSPLLKTVSTAQAAVADVVPSESPQASAQGETAAGSGSSLAIINTDETKITGPTASEIVQAYYEDAAQIPEEAINNVAIATKEGIVVNYPDPDLLNPNEPISRGEVSALVHQTLVDLGKLEPLAEDIDVTQYIIGPISDQELTAEFGQSQ